jgi:hypothetical protein
MIRPFFKRGVLKKADNTFGFLNWTMLKTYGACVDRVQKANS